jgi:hypothetical protein
MRAALRASVAHPDHAVAVRVRGSRGVGGLGRDGLEMIRRGHVVEPSKVRRAAAGRAGRTGGRDRAEPLLAPE